MENAHLRFGLLEYVRFTEKASTRIRLRVDRYIGEDRQAHLLSVFGNDSDVGAITAAIHEKAAFNLAFPDGTVKDVTLGEHASCYKGTVTLPGRKHPVRHLLAVSQELHTNGSAGRTILLRYRREEAWATLVSFLGLPADPTWADHALGIVEGKKRIEEIDGIGCQPVLISATTEEVLEWVGEGLQSKTLSFPEKNGPIIWPNRSWQQFMSVGGWIVHDCSTIGITEKPQMSDRYGFTFSAGPPM
ncbi:MAG: hypothetical protein ROO76_13625 [Terriglobia bacterium]|nr:hypothetical protein [Terriglobia bacterium]